METYWFHSLMKKIINKFCVWRYLSVPATFVPLANWSRAGEARIYYLIDWHITTAAKKTLFNNYYIQSQKILPWFWEDLSAKHLQQASRWRSPLSSRSLANGTERGRSACNAHAESDGHFRRVRSVLDRCLAVAHAAASPTAAIKPNLVLLRLRLVFWFEFRRVRASTPSAALLPFPFS